MYCSPAVKHHNINSILYSCSSLKSELSAPKGQFFPTNASICYWKVAILPRSLCFLVQLMHILNFKNIMDLIFIVLGVGLQAFLAH